MPLDNKQLYFPSLQLLWSKDLKQLDKREYINPQISTWSSYTLSLSTQPQKISWEIHGDARNKYLFPSLARQSQPEIKAIFFPPLFHNNERNYKGFQIQRWCALQATFVQFQPQNSTYNPRLSLCDGERFKPPVDPWSIWYQASFNNSLSSSPIIKTPKYPPCLNQKSHPMLCWFVP